MKSIVLCAFLFIFNSISSQTGAAIKKQTATNSGKIDIKPKFKYDITHSKNAFIIDQLSTGHTKGCWAYAATTMYEWTKQASYSVEEVLKIASYRSAKNINYSKLFSNYSGLPIKNISDFGNSMDWVPLNYSPDALILYELLASKGPLLLFHNMNPKGSPISHALIIIGLKTSDFNDPNYTYLEYLDPWYGQHSYMTFAEYAQKYTSLKGPVNFIYHNK